MNCERHSPQASRLEAIAQVQNYEQFINSSRADFLRNIQGEPSFENILKLSEDLTQRLDFYRKMHLLRRELKEAARQSHVPCDRTFDFSLRVRSGNESKEYDFVDRQASELLIVLQRMKDEIE